MKISNILDILYYTAVLAALVALGRLLTSCTLTDRAEEVAALRAWKAAGHKAENFPTAYVFASRAYYRDSMGKPGVNDTGIYDDAVFILTRRLIYRAVRLGGWASFKKR